MAVVTVIAMAIMATAVALFVAIVANRHAMMRVQK